MDLLDEYRKQLKPPDSYEAIRAVIRRIAPADEEAIKLLFNLTESLEYNSVSPERARKILAYFCKKM